LSNYKGSYKGSLNNKANGNEDENGNGVVKQKSIDDMNADISLKMELGEPLTREEEQLLQDQGLHYPKDSIKKN